MRQHTRRTRVRRRIWIPALATLALFLVACSTESGPENGQNSLRPKGAYAKEIDNLFTPVLWIAVAVGVFICGATIFVAVKFRAKKGSDDRPKQIHGSTPLEIGWTLVPALILAVIAVPTVSTIFSLSEAPKDAIEVTVIGKQWWWEFQYPKDDGGKQVVTANELHIPTGRDVELKLSACDASLGVTASGADECNVIHSFWVPELNGKKDVVPGMTNTTKIKTDQEGTFLGQCAEYCGLSHANMRFRVIAESPDEYAEWLAGQREGPTVPLADDADAEELFNTTYGCSGCHAVTDSSLSSYGPNLTHLASRETFASGYYELTRENLIDWILDAPGMIPMQSEYCRLPAPATCVGMPSFTKNTPPKTDGVTYPVMTRAQAETLADYLLELK